LCVLVSAGGQRTSEFHELVFVLFFTPFPLCDSIFSFLFFLFYRWSAYFRMSGTTPRVPVTLWRADLHQDTHTHTQRKTERVIDTDTDSDARMDTHANGHRHTHNPDTPTPTQKRTRTHTLPSPGSHVASTEEQKEEPKVGPKKKGNITGAWEVPLIERYLEIERQSESR
jgi:hypothetical protein